MHTGFLHNATRHPGTYAMEILAILLVTGMMFLTLTLRGLSPYDETRYMAVAWEM